MSELFKNAKHVQFFPCRGLGILKNDYKFIGVDNIRYKAVIVDSDGGVHERGVIGKYNNYEEQIFSDDTDVIVVHCIEIEDDFDELLEIQIGGFEFEGDKLDMVVCELINTVLRATDVKIGHYAKEYIEELKLRHKYEEHYPNVEHDCW